ncbi:MAG TPA: hypothetical protein VMU58_00770, partial [Gaiellaceae bacterium]|nr:hypothetical protein [Gaiellaceae bacterium]
YVGLLGHAAAALTLAGDPGNYVIYELDGPGGTIIGDGTLDATTGILTVPVDFSGYDDGVYEVTANQYSKAGNGSPVLLSTPTLTLDTVTPTGSFAVDGAASNTALTRNPAVTLALSFADGGSGLYLYQVSADGGSTWSAWQAYSASSSATLPAPDGTYNVLVRVSDQSGNILLASQTVILDRTGPALAAALSAPSNGTSYDVGTPIGLTWVTSDLNGVHSSSAAIEGQTISSSGGTIDVDLLTAGSHTVTITSTDNAGNVTTQSITFTIHATPDGILKAVNDGAARGWIGASFASTLVTQIQQVIKAEPNHANMKAKLRQFITYLQYPPAGGITAAYDALLLNWSNDLLGRL